MKGGLILNVFLVALVYLLTTIFIWLIFPDFTVIFLRWATTLGILGAITAALFGDYLREKLFPIDLCIESPNEQERNVGFDKRIFNEQRFQSYPEIYGKGFDVYNHHLRVRNLTAHRPIKDCRVWLKKMGRRRPVCGPAHDGMGTV